MNDAGLFARNISRPFVRSSGALYCWGYNQFGELGLGNATQYNTPQQVGSGANWTAVSVLNNYEGREADACGIAGGKLYCWGKNGDGEDGVGNADPYNTPQQVGLGVHWTAVSIALGDACGIEGGKLYCWGKNSDGEDGVGDTHPHDTPQLVHFESARSKTPPN